MPKRSIVRRRAFYRSERNFRNSRLISLDPRTVFLGGILLLVLGAFSPAQAAQPVNLAGDTSTLAPVSTPLPTPNPDATLFANGPSNVVQTWNDGAPVELGVKFKSAAAGKITAIRFYKALANTSRHVGNLWSASGTLLASVNFNNETGSGWQQATLSNPVAITAGTIYVASYHTTIYSRDDNYFTTTPPSWGPLTAPDSSTCGGNGVYAYGSASRFPTQSYDSRNYWVDVVFAQSVNLPPPPAVALDVTAKINQGTPSATVVTPSFSTTAAYELLLVFVAADHYSSGTNTTVTKVTGAGLSWTLVKRTNAQAGTAEIWRAFASMPLSQVNVAATLSRSVTSSMTVMTFKGVDTTGIDGSGAIGATGTSNAGSGAPTARLVTTRNDSWVVGVGNDSRNAISRTVGANQTLVHQYLTPLGSTHWEQMQSKPIPWSGTRVTINDTAPTNDPYNLALCEILPFPYLPVP
jgi:Domain of unknown function (DUF4082)